MARRRSRERTTLRHEDLQGLRTRAYVRESTKAQAGPEHQGPDVQRRWNSDYCTRYGVSPPDFEYFETASGRSAEKRPQLQRALADAEEYDVLLIGHSSRAYRNREDAAIGKRQFREAGVRMVFTSQDIIVGNTATKLMEAHHEAQDEQRSDDIGEFVYRGLLQKSERGLHNGPTPFGYARHHGQPGDPQNRVLEPLAGEAATVLRAYELYAPGRRSYTDVAAAINAEADAAGAPKHRSRRGTPLTSTTIRDVLRNRVYVGEVVWHPGTPEENWRPGRHEPIVPRELFDQVQAVRRARTRAGGRRSPARSYLLSRRLVCQRCGAAYAGDTGGKRNHRRYRHARDARCEAPRRSFASQCVEGQMADFLAATLPDEWQSQVLRLIAAPQVEDDGTEQRVASLERAIEQLRKQHTWGDIGDGMYRAERRRLERELSDLQSQGRAPIEIHAVQESAKMLKDIGALWDHPGVSDESRTAFIQEVFESIQLDENGIRAVLPAEMYRPLFAVAAVGGNGAGEGVRTRDPLLGKPRV